MLYLKVLKHCGLLYFLFNLIFIIIDGSVEKEMPFKKYDDEGKSAIMPTVFVHRPMFRFHKNWSNVYKRNNVHVFLFVCLLVCLFLFLCVFFVCVLFLFVCLFVCLFLFVYLFFVFWGLGMSIIVNICWYAWKKWGTLRNHIARKC